MGWIYFFFIRARFFILFYFFNKIRLKSIFILPMFLTSTISTAFAQVLFHDQLRLLQKSPEWFGFFFSVAFGHHFWILIFLEVAIQCLK